MDGRNCPTCGGTGEIRCECEGDRFSGNDCPRCFLGYRRCGACNGSGSKTPYEELFHARPATAPARYVTVARDPRPGSPDCDGVILYDGPSRDEAEASKEWALPGYVVTIITPDW